MSTSTNARHPARVLIVEPDADLAMGVIRECSKLGMEPKLCRGPRLTSACPALEGARCERPDSVEATLVSISDGLERRVAPVCGGGRVLVAGERPLVGPHTIGALGADAVIGYPYDPRDAARLLYDLVHGERAGPARMTSVPRPSTA